MPTPTPLQTRAALFSRERRRERLRKFVESFDREFRRLSGSTFWLVKPDAKNPSQQAELPVGDSS